MRILPFHLTVIAAASVLVLVGCGSAGQSSPTASATQSQSTTASSSASSPAPTGTPTLEALEAGATKEGKLVWYTALNQEAVTALLNAFKVKYASIDVSEFFRAPSATVYAKIQTELGAGQHVADVVDTSQIGAFLTMEQKQQLAQYVSPELSQWPSQLKSPGYWTIWRIAPLIIAYNTNVIQPDEAPKCFADLTKSALAHQVGFESAASGTQQMEWYVLRAKLGADYWPSVAKNGAVSYQGTAPLLNALSTGEIGVAGMAGANAPYQFPGAPIKMVYPCEGMALNLDTVAILIGAPHPDAARLFVNFLLSQDAQQILVTTNKGDYSPRADVSPAPGLPSLKSVPQLYPDSYPNLLASQAEFPAQWNSLFQK